nr:serine/threonine-protein kinase [Kibdelosporangium sp. MJ126-NF4]CEL13950.1 serine/threonine protein kinase [Kibdelosporangium sp. MJ126-NF4]CTQ88319.1 serine/threonine protein kinase [Kibdelosporangium sp. MJ126-NF4]
MSACAEPGCTGSYGSHGYCDECGHKAAGSDRRDPGGGKQSSRSVAREESHPVSAPVVSRPVSSSRFGAGWVSMPKVTRGAAAAAAPVPEIDESQRFCRTCKAPVGRGRNGNPGRPRGFCTKDGTPFCFEPTLAAGDTVDRYEIDRCIARGGQGWIYLAHDTHFDDTGAQRPVVLKGVIDSADPDAIEQARQERRFLIEVDHPNIVKVGDFVRHPDPLTATMAGYLVMEYIDGRTLLDLHREHRDEDGHRAPLPLTHVLAYGIEVLQAMAYLHEKDLVYCDFKPDNAMHTGDQLKLIDLGAVVRASEVPDSFLGTVGYQAPEVVDTGPTVVSDLYTVGRSLAVLSFDFEGFTRQFHDRLPDRDDVPLLAANESFDLVLRRATDPDPAKRFTSAEQMSGQLEGVLLEVLAAAGARTPPGPSRTFTVEQRTFGTDSLIDDAESSVDWAGLVPALPTPLVDPMDPGAGHLAALAAADPDSVIDALLAIPVDSPEIVLQLVGARIAAGHLEAAHQDLDAYAVTAPHDWRVAWYRGLAALAASRPRAARPYFEQVYAALPGELPPKLALAAASEWDGDDDRAGPLYERVWRTDTRYVSAAFGFARVLERRGEPAAAVEALDGVPEDSAQHTLAQVAAIRACLAPNLAKADLLAAGARLARLRIGIERQAELSVEVFQAALDWVRGNEGVDGGGEVLGRALEDRQLRFGLEKAYRDLAGVTKDVDRRIELVRTANRVRPRTLF